MAHLADGVVAMPVIVAGTAIAAAGIAQGLRHLDAERLPACGLLAAAFFIASLVHVPVGPSSVHLILNGLLGVLLGWAAVPAIFVALVLQCLFFGYGGITVIGLNTAIMATPAVVCFLLFAGPIQRAQRSRAMFWAGLAGGAGVVLTCLGVAAALALSGSALWVAAKLVLLAHLPVIVVEAVITGVVVGFVHRVRPSLLALPATLGPAAGRA